MYNHRRKAAVLLSFIIISLFNFTAVSAAPQFANPQFKNIWEYSDKRVDEIPGAGRGYTWGPNSFGMLSESYLESIGGKRQVQYFDKSRMELSSDGKFVTNGLLTKELVTGARQDGDAKFTQLAPSTVQVAGDDNSGGGNAAAPTYASFKNVVTFNPGENTAPNQVGKLVNQSINKAGEVNTLDKPPARVNVGAYEALLGHNIPQVFLDFQNQTGLVWNGGNYVLAKIYTDNPTANVFGYAISEAFWAKAVVAGAEKDVLIQLYERRVLTYTPSNPVEFRVEMGNIGQHYYQWRYSQPQPSLPLDLANLNRTGDGSWGWLYPSTPAVDLRAVQCPAINACFAVGSLGAILFSVDGGRNWSGQTSNSDASLGRLSCPTPQNCYAIGNWDFVATGDGGRNWTTYPGVLGVWIDALSCPEANVCLVAADGVFNITKDGGATWRELGQVGIVDVSALVCLSVTTCYATGADGEISSTKDGGNSWKKLNSPATDTLFDIACPSENVCYASGWNGTIVATTDGGNTWNLQETPKGLWHLTRLACLDIITCYAVGWLGSIIVTGDGGKHWVAQVSGLDKPGKRYDLTGISCATVKNCVAVGREGTLLFTQDGGNKWEHFLTQSLKYLRTITCPTKDVCFAGGRNELLLATTDGGSSWKEQKIAPAASISKFACLSTTTCFGVGEKGNFYATSDGGNNWVTQNVSAGADMYDIECIAPSTCYVAGKSGSVLISVDGGNNWSKQNTGTSTDLSDISCPTALACYAVGATGTNYWNNEKHEGVVVKTTDGGKTWTATTGTAGQEFIAISCPGATTCFATNSQKSDAFPWRISIYKTTDSGKSWTRVAQANGPSKITCPTEQICYTANYDGTVSYTSNGGKNWVQQLPGAGYDNSEISCPAPDYCFLVGFSTSSGSTGFILTNARKP